MADIRLKGSAGPVGNSKIANKTLRSKPSKLRAPSDHQREVVRVYSSAPSLEKRSFGTEKDQIYDGEVNVLLIIEGNTDIMCCKYTQDVKEIAVGFGDGSIRTFDATTGACTHTLVDAESISYPGSVTAIKHRPISNAQPVTNTFIASYVNGSIRYWKYKCEKCLYTIREKRQTLGVSYHPRWSKFITYGDDAVLNMYDEEAQTQERAYFSKEPTSKITNGAPRTGHTSRIFACTFHPRSNHELVSGGWDNTVMCWDDRQPHATRYFSGVHMCGEGIDFDKSGRTIITCSWQERDVIQVWDYGSAKLIGSIEPDSHPSKLFCGRLVPMTNLMVCGGSDGNILKLVDIIHHETACAIRNNPGSVYGFDFGTIRRKTSKVERLLKRTSDIQRVPRVAFVTGKRLQIVDFG